MDKKLKIAIIGPESTGKSVLSKRLATRFGGSAVPEYAADYIAQKGKDIDINDLDIMLDQQLKNEQADQGAITFCDSDALTTKLWSQFLFDDVSTFVDSATESSKERYDLTILMKPTVEWVDDEHRYTAEDEVRQKFFDDFKSELERLGRPYKIVDSDSWAQRFVDACKIVEDLKMGKSQPSQTRDKQLGKDPETLKGLLDKKIKNGLVFGKFMPPTKGHMLLLEHANQACENLTIMVLSLEDEPIKGELRYQWVKELFPNCNVIHHTDDMPQEPIMTADDPDGANDIEFFEAWRKTIEKHNPNVEFDALFASETYGFRVADIIEAKFIPVDIDRGLVPVSGTMVRNDPFANWDYLPEVVKPYFLKNVAVIDVSNDKSTKLSSSLAKEFNTLSVKPYRDIYLDICNKQIDGYEENHFDDDALSTIVRGQIATENALKRQANKVLFTSMPIFKAADWAQKMAASNAVPEWIGKTSSLSDYDYYVLVKPRRGNLSKAEFEQNKTEFESLKEDLKAQDIPFKVVSNQNQKIKAIKALKKHFKL